MPAITTLLISAGLGVAQGVSAISNAQKQKSLAREAESAAAEAIVEAKNIAQTQFQEEVQVPLEAYELQTQANLAAQEQSVSKLAEAGDRALIGGVGALAGRGQEASTANRLSMQTDLYNRDALIAAERMGIRDTAYRLNLAEATGAQQAAADADYARMMYNQQALQGFGSAGVNALKATDLYFGFGDKKNNGAGSGGTKKPQETPFYEIVDDIPSDLGDLS